MKIIIKKIKRLKKIKPPGFKKPKDKYNHIWKKIKCGLKNNSKQEYLLKTLDKLLYRVYYETICLTKTLWRKKNIINNILKKIENEFEIIIESGEIVLKEKKDLKKLHKDIKDRKSTRLNSSH